MILSGYLAPAAVSALAAPIDAEPVGRIRAAAAELGVAAAFGCPELAADGSRHNSFVLVDAGGRVAAVYRKVHLWGTEAEWAVAGAEVPVVEIAGARVTGWICFDTRFPELARLAALGGAEVAVVPTAWLGPPEEWELSLRARALDNSLFAAGADIIDAGIGCHGHSMIVDPKGRVLARAQPDQEGLICASLDPAVRAAQQGRLHLLEARRPALYRGLA
jgi:predicted amidohydrolase